MSAEVPTSPEQHRFEYAAELFCAGKSLKSIAFELGGMTVRHVRRILQHPVARRAIAEIRAQSLSAVSGYVQKRLRKAGQVIDELLESDDDRLRLSAARTAFEVGLNLKAVEELEARLMTLERRAAEREAVPA